MELAATPEGFVLPNSPSVAVELWAGRGRIESLRVHRDEAFLSLLPVTDEPHVYSARQARVVCVTAFFLGSWFLLCLLQAVHGAALSFFAGKPIHGVL